MKKLATLAPIGSLITFARSTRGPVSITPEEIPHFIRGEVPPAIAERFTRYGMPDRGLITYTITIREKTGARTIGPSLCRRAGTRSSALR